MTNFDTIAHIVLLLVLLVGFWFCVKGDEKLGVFMPNVNLWLQWICVQLQKVVVGAAVYQRWLTAVQQNREVKAYKNLMKPFEVTLLPMCTTIMCINKQVVRYYFWVINLHYGGVGPTPKHTHTLSLCDLVCIFICIQVKFLI